ncbi:MAG: hypothetical protein Q9167_006895 [Letrouitia subvulpina]
MEQNHVADLNRIVGEITSFGRTTSTYKPSTIQHGKGTEDAELLYAGQDDQYHPPRTTPQDESQEIQTLTGDNDQSKASPTFASTISIPSYQQRINFISRPKSAHNDLSPGFTFGKAQPLKPLKFDRKQCQTFPERVFREKSIDGQKDSCHVTTEGSHICENTDDPNLQPNDLDVSSDSIQSTILAGRNMKMAHEGHNDGMNASKSSTQDSLAFHDPSLRGVPTPNGQALSNISEHAHITPVETNLVTHDGQEPFVGEKLTLPPDSFSHQNFDAFINRVNDKNARANDQTIAAPTPPSKVTETVCHTPKSLRATSLSITEDKTQSRPVQNPSLAASEPFVPLDSSQLLSDEQLIRVFISRYRDQYQASIQSKAKEVQQTAEIQDLTGVCYKLHDHLTKAQADVTAKEKDLLRYNEQKSRWQVRISKLSDHVQRLNNDHHHLLDGFRAIDNQQKGLLAEKDTLERSLKEIRNALELKHSKSRNHSSKARQTVRRLQEALKMQDVQLRQESLSLQIERDNSKRLQDELSRINASHERVVKTLSHEGALLMTKMDSLSGWIGGISDQEKSFGQAATREEVQECFELIREIRKVETVQEQGFQNLCTSMRDHFDRVMDAVKALNLSGMKNVAKQEELATEMTTHVLSLDSNIREGKSLKEQVCDLREIKATLREQLKATEAYLVEARQHAIELEKNERRHLKRISSLEEETALLRKKAESFTGSLFHTQLIEQEKESLSNQLSSSQKETEYLRTALQNKDKDVEGTKERCQALNEQLSEAQNKIATLIREKNGAEAKAKFEGDQMKRQHSLALQVEISKIGTEYTTQIQQLKDERKEIDAMIESQEAQVQRLQANQGSLEIFLTHKETRIDELQKDIKKSAELLECHVKAVQTLTFERDEACQNTQKVQAEKEAAFTEIVDLQKERDATKRLAHERSEDLAKIRIDREEAEKDSQHLQFRCRTLGTQLETKIRQIRQLEDALAAERSVSAQQATTSLPPYAKKASVSGSDLHQRQASPVNPIAKASQAACKPFAVVEDSQNIDMKYHSDKQRGVVEDSQGLGSGNLKELKRPLTSESTESQNILMPSQIAGLMYAESPQDLINITDMFPTTPELLDRFGTPPACSVQQSRAEDKSPAKRGMSSKDQVAKSHVQEEQRASTDGTSIQYTDVKANTPVKTPSRQMQSALREDRRSILFRTESSSHSQTLQIKGSGGKRKLTQAGYVLNRRRPKKSKLSAEKTSVAPTVIDSQSPTVSQLMRHRKGPRSVSKVSHREDKFLARFTKELAA